MTLPVRIAMIGAGNRARKYLDYILSNPSMAQVVAVVDPNPLRRHEIALKCGLTDAAEFSDATDFFALGHIADAVIIASPDDCHYPQSMAAIALGYHIMLEKPVAQTVEEAREIAEAARRAGLIVNVCYVLHFHPYFIKLRELVTSGEYGKIISVSHRAPVGIDRAAHVYVRGIWGRKETSGPLFTSKCCHDLDYLLWITGSRYKSVNSYGTLRWFTPANAPAGSTPRCIDCQVEDTCPYSAVDLYRRRRDWVSNFDIKPGQTLGDAIEQELREGPCGRCIYHCDNDVTDRQTVSMEMEDGSIVDMTLDVFTTRNNRITTILMTGAEIEGDESTIRVTTFRPHVTTVYDFSDLVNAPYHAGADLLTVKNFIDSIHGQPDDTHTTIDDAIESQELCDLIEASRLSNSCHA